MAIKVPCPDDVNQDPDAKYHRSAHSAFLCNAFEAEALTEHRRPFPYGRVLMLALLVMFVTALSTCNTVKAVAPQTDKVEAAAKKACPPGHAVVWSGPTEMECVKEIK